VEFVNFGGAPPKEPSALTEEFRSNLGLVAQVLRRDQGLVDYLADRLVDLGDSVPKDIPTFCLGRRGNPWKDARLFDAESYPPDLFAKPGTSVANRAGLAKWGAWVNAFGHRVYGRPLFIACSADLADSTNISGFAKAYGDFPGYGWYERYGTQDGVLLPQEITEFANAGILVGMATVNFAEDPEQSFDGFWGACSTYGSFSYLKYGMLRLFSQLAQDCQWKVGKVMFVAGHSGPETADDSRTHFGVFEPAVMQLFPKGRVLNLHPWEHNEVPVLLAAAFREDVPVVVLHLTRPPIEIPDRQALGMASHFEAARGAYLVRDYRPGTPKAGTLIVQGTSAMVSVCRLLPELETRRLNVKIVYAASPELYARQPASYREHLLPAGDRADSTVITTQSRASMGDWMFNEIAQEYALSSDRDDRWRTGGTVDEVIDEAGLSPQRMIEGIARFAADREHRLARLERAVAEARRDGEPEGIVPEPAAV
jgi:transketolase